MRRIISLDSSEEELRYYDLHNTLFDCRFLTNSSATLFLAFAISSQHPTTSPARVVEITSSRTEQDDQSKYPLPGAGAAADVAGSSVAAVAAPSALSAIAVPLVDLTASTSTPDSLLSHVSPFSLRYFFDYWERDQRSRWE